jgi:hypothetical protein
MLVPLSLSMCEAQERYPGSDQIEKLGRSMAAQLAGKARGPVALAPFIDGESKPLPKAHWLERDFAVAIHGANPAFRLVERTESAPILREHRLQESGLINPSDMKRAGQLLGAQVVVNCAVVLLGETVQVNALAWDVATNEQLAGAAVALPYSAALAGQLGALRRAPRPEAHPLQQTQAAGIDYQLLACKRKGREVSCQVNLISRQGDLRVRLSRDSYIVDPHGRRYEAARLNTGRQIGWRLLLKDVPSQARIDFPGVPRDVDVLAELKLQGKSIGAVFRRIPLRR